VNDQCYYSYYAGKGVIRASTEKKGRSDDIVGDDDDDDYATISRNRRTIVTGLTLFSAGLLNIRARDDSDYSLYLTLPVGPYKRKKTVFTEVVPDQIWTGEQKFGILNVQVPLRMTVVRLPNNNGSGDSLLVYNPLSATREVVSWVRQLERHYNAPVRHIVLGSVAAEHKVYTGVFAQSFPQAKVWLTPGQYAYPLNLPVQFLGFPIGRTFIIPFKNKSAANMASTTARADTGTVVADWMDHFHYEILGPFISKDGAYGETVLYHKATKTLLVTDTVLEVTDDVPEIYNDDPKPLLYHARDTVTDIVQDTSATRLKGWRRICLFGLFFNPGAIHIKNGNQAFQERRPDINPDFIGIYPWDWVGDEMASWAAIKGGLLVAPILQKLILNRNPIETLDFADKVATWDIERIIPSHFNNDLRYDGKAYRKAFSFLEVGGVPKGFPKPLDSDFAALASAEQNLIDSGTIAKTPPLPGGKVSRAEILQQTTYGCRAGLCTPKSTP